ncbi:disulfide bond formation protein B [Aquincola sp. S2]|uniref:Disulfide bond formation protein B n=1 Tax=Pseudaquabacterium terrae TaxID=2732868 RepID=A0ABX2EN80_9BURK|nr:disulfide bond formation protein B [Aquabacterium terrae]NRF70027.1 disulfide bond formation protein B [Aquabacterium terrae]
MIALLAFGAVGVALYTQHARDMQPCPWCVLQRLVFVAIGAWAVIGFVMRGGLGQRVVAIIVSLLASAGIAAALWQHFVAAASASCNQTFADKFIAATGLDGLLPDVFAAYASCADAKVDLFGVPYEFYSLALFAVLDMLAVLTLLRRR